MLPTQIILKSTVKNIIRSFKVNSNLTMEISRLLNFNGFAVSLSQHEHPTIIIVHQDVLRHDLSCD